MITCTSSRRRGPAQPAYRLLPTAYCLLLAVHQSADSHGMDQFIIFALFVGSILTTLAAARGMLGLLLHLMTLGRSSERFATSRRHTTASL